MSTLSIIAIVLFSCFAIGMYSHYTADSFAFRICLRDNIVKAMKARNVSKMIKLEKAIRKTVKGSGQHWMLTGKWKELRSYNVVLGSI